MPPIAELMINVLIAKLETFAFVLPCFAAQAQLSWTPTASQVGGHVICLVATDTSATRTDPVASAPACYSIVVRTTSVTGTPVLDLNGEDMAGLDFSAAFYKGENQIFLLMRSDSLRMVL